MTPERTVDPAFRPGPARPLLLPVAVTALLALFPLLQIQRFFLWGALGSWTDLLIAVVVLAGLLDLILVLLRGGAREAGGRTGEDFSRGALFLLLFALWVLVSARWGFHPAYALTKGMGLTALALAAACVRWSGLDWRRAADAWLLGTLCTLLLVWIPALVGPEGLRSRFLYFSGMVHGIPLPRVSGPFSHPNLFGDYLVLSGVLLWARWPALRRRLGPALPPLVALFGLTFLLTTSSAWLPAGVLLVLWGGALARAPASGRGPGLAVLAGGVVLVMVTAVGLLAPVSVPVGPVEIETGGIRPRIWISAVDAFLTAPLAGVGAAPFLAEAAEPGDPDAIVHLWDARSAYLSVLGQFGLVGFALLGAALWFLVRRLRHPALLAGILAMAIHGLVISGEDFRHWWLWLGLVGLGLVQGRDPDPDRELDRDRSHDPDPGPP